MTSTEKMDTLKTFANFPAATRYGFAAGYAAAKAEEAAEKSEAEGDQTKDQRPA